MRNLLLTAFILSIAAGTLSRCGGDKKEITKDAAEPKADLAVRTDQSAAVDLVVHADTADPGETVAPQDTTKPPPDQVNTPDLPPEQVAPETIAEVSPDLADCIAKHSGCECYGDCADGFGVTVYYPKDAGDFPEDFSAPPELLEVAVAQYDCSHCEPCTEGWLVKVDGQWQPTDVVGLCQHVKEYNEQCDDCLKTWWGGCC